jgi:delta1-piperideine-2-carboxylate reductase
MSLHSTAIPKDGAEHFLPFEALVALLDAIFQKHGVSPRTAAILAFNCAACERDGSLSHGIFRMPGYVSSLKSRWVDGRAEPVVDDVGPSFLRVDARNGFTQAALAAARPLLLDKVRANGMALLAIHNSHHFSALWPDVEPFAEEGFVALAFVNSFACVVPYGGKSAVFGTNPVAFATPRAGGAPFVFDQASSSMANGDVQIAAKEGRQLPAGMGVDRAGNPTTDPREVLDGGALLTFGGYKGSSIAFMIEVLGAALTGGQFSFEVDWTAYEGAQTPKTGQLVIVIDPARGGNDHFADRVSGLIEHVHEAGQKRLPGDRRLDTRALSLKRGVAISVSDMQVLRKLGV